jgi:hypothetical protein
MRISAQNGFTAEPTYCARRPDHKRRPSACFCPPSFELPCSLFARSHPHQTRDNRCSGADYRFLKTNLQVLPFFSASLRSLPFVLLKLIPCPWLSHSKIPACAHLCAFVRLSREEIFMLRAPHCNFLTLTCLRHVIFVPFFVSPRHKDTIITCQRRVTCSKATRLGHENPPKYKMSKITSRTH